MLGGGPETYPKFAEAMPVESEDNECGMICVLGCIDAKLLMESCENAELIGGVAYCEEFEPKFKEARKVCSSQSSALVDRFDKGPESTTPFPGGYLKAISFSIIGRSYA